MNFWTESQKAFVKEKWEAGISAGTISAELGTTRSAIIGLVHRNHWITPNTIASRTSHNPREKKEPRQVPYNIQRALERGNSPSPQPPLERDPAPTVDDLAIPMEQRRTLMDLTSKTCRFPVGNPGSANFFFCGAEPMEGRPYCRAHFLRATQPLRYNPPQPHSFSLAKNAVRL
jgi:GcrA cell cycle regulator